MGSKNRIAKYLLPIILKERKEGQWYVEPFCGGFNVIDKVKGLRIANDINPYLISLFKGIQQGFVPPETISEEEYKEAREHKDITPLVGFIGFGCSYSGKWFGGYARGTTSTGLKRNYCKESKDNILKQVKPLENVLIFNCPYFELVIPDTSIIYCDPPYRNTTKYKDSIDYEHFYNWCREKKAEGHTVFISEYTMPEDFTCVWSREQTSSLSKDTGSKVAIERLYTL